MALAFAASLISIWTGISVALIEILVGVAAGNLLHLHATTDWSVVILSAFVPTLVAQKLFQPTAKTMHAWGRLYRRKENVRPAIEPARN
jgi:hypothetical protein